MKDTNLIIGKINTGKTRGILFKEVEKAIKKEENLLLYDNRDEYYKTFSKTLKNNSYHVYVLNLQDCCKSNGFNPLTLPYELYKEGNTDKAMELVDELSHEIFKEENGVADPFWTNMAASYFTGLILILFRNGQKEEINIGSVQVIMNKGAEKSLLQQYISTLEVTDLVYTLLSPIEFAPSETKGSIISVVKSYLNKYLLREKLLNLLSNNEINLKDLKDKTAIFILGNTKINAIANIFINQLLQMTSKNKKSYTIILDNFTTLPLLTSLSDILLDATYFNNKLFVAIQDIEEMKEKYKDIVIKNFQNRIEMKETVELAVIGEDDEYPILELKPISYYTFTEK